MKPTNQRVSEHRESMKAAGYVWRGLWVRPEGWADVKAEADKINRRIERQNKQAEKEAK